MAREDPEDRIERSLREITEPGSPRTINLLIAWMRENRQAFADRLQSLEGQLEAIFGQLAKLNGTVGHHDHRLDDLEQASEIAKLLKDERDRWEKELREARAQRSEGWRWRVDLIVGGGCIVLGGGVGAFIAHLLGG